MLRVRAILIIVALLAAIYSLAPASRKERIRGKIKEIGTALTLAIIVYWIYMLSVFVWNHWD
jgi:hypothetical protein